ncbi:MAG TPA: DUF5916 domain-containing protein [Acidobacteriota bacterium]|jgi:hypothetical protein
MLRSIRTAIIVCIALLLASPAASAALPADGERPVMRALRASGPIVIDGDLNEPDWQRVEPASGFIQKIPRTGDPATEQTEVRILYDDNNLYLGVYCLDSAGSRGIVVNDISKDFFTLDSDGFQVVLDTFHDKRNCFLFGTNPKGGKFDMQIGADGAAGNTDWDGIWYVKTRVDERGWQIEMAIPFKTLRFHEAEEQIWGINFERRVRRKFEDSYWAALQPPYRVSRVSLAGTLQGLRGIKQPRNLYVKPYLSAPLGRKENDDVDFNPDAGLDLKYGVSSQMTFDATLNTDFSQVEADDAQINLTRFSLFFPEKRDFFLENAGTFIWGRPKRRPMFGPDRSRRLDLIPFFSRRIGLTDDGELVPIRGGARLTGRAGPYNLGLLSMQTGRFESLPETNFSVVRLRRDLSRYSDAGGIFINKYEDGGRFNRTYGADTNLRFFQYLDVTSYLLKTDSPGKHGRDQAGDLEVSWRDSLFDVRAGHLWIGENFNPEVGFAPRRGIRKTSGEFNLTPRPGERMAAVREFQPTVEFDYITDPEGRLETRRLETRFGVLFSNSSFVLFGREANFERLDEPFAIRKNQKIPVGDYRFDQYSAYYQSDRSRILSAILTVSTGGFYDGDRDSLGGTLVVQPDYHFLARFSWNHDDVRLPTGNFKTNLLSSRLNYSFTTNLFLSALIQYNSDDHAVTSNIRLNFIYRPLSNFFLVYNERRSSTGIVTERALIAKLTRIFAF